LTAAYDLRPFAGSLGAADHINMKYFVWLISAVNVYLGLRASLNAVGVLQTSKYSQATTVIFAILFLGLGVAGFYISIAKNNPKLALLVAFGPWVLAMIVLFITMVTSDYQ
jgi:hypothetical protein